ncbi:MAG: hypothetical protein O9325_06350 [Roseomonas sp.]|nr:hypothetical protein [Roseomonas sp.]
MTKPFRGTYTVLITPFTPDGEAVDIPALARYRHLPTPQPGVGGKR